MKDINIVKFADDNANHYMSSNNTTNLAKNLEDSSCSFFKWFAYNQMQRNTTKCHVLLGTKQRSSYKR